jgi:hypothetical protein
MAALPRFTLDMRKPWLHSWGRVKPPLDKRSWGPLAALYLLAAMRLAADEAKAPQCMVSVSWDKTVANSRSTPTLQVVVNPMLRPGSSMHDNAVALLRATHANFVRFVPWLPYPRLAVAELEPPTSSGTSWDFTLVDPMVKDFVEATGGAPIVMNFSTIPAWMFKAEKPVAYPSDPNALAWEYTQGTDLRDPTGKELGDYYARLFSWYTHGGFSDENGRRHTSGLYYKFPLWEVLNEVESEHSMTPRQYTDRYDAIVNAIRAVGPGTQFMGLALEAPSEDGAWLEYFLDHANHRPGTPLDYISYHFYATPARGESPETWQFTFFDQADRFLATVRYIELIRKRLSPSTKTDTNEIGSILPGDPGSLKGPPPEIPDAYWDVSGAMFAYLYASLAREGIDVIGESQLIGYPSQFPSVTMMDWSSAQPNARYWVLRLLIDHFHPGDQLVETKVDGSSDVFAQGFITPSGKTLLLVNKRNHPVVVTLPAAANGVDAATVEIATGKSYPRLTHPETGTLTLAPFAVATVSTR